MEFGGCSLTDRLTVYMHIFLRKEMYSLGQTLLVSPAPDKSSMGYNAAGVLV